MGSISRRGGAYQVELAPEFAGALAAGGGYALPSGAIGQLPAGSAQHLMEAPDPEEMKSDLEKQVTKLARNHPETVAEVVQSWLREDQ
jgi:flagellar biosynthesis/type III secretory pathway M-ring protein FliF/YscJ